MEIIKKYIRAVSIMNEWLGRVACFLIIPLVFITIYEIIMRKIFNAPTLWVFETSNQLYATSFMLGIGFGLLHGCHVSIDIISRFFTLRGKAILDSIMFIIFFFPFVIVLLVQGIMYAGQAWAIMETSQTALRMPLYPLKTTIPIMAATLLLQGIAVFIGKLHMAFTGRELTV